MADKQTTPEEEVQTAGEVDQQEAMPASEEKPTDQPLEEAEQAVETNQEEDLTLPDGVSERTRQQFEKLKRKNRELAQKLSKVESSEPEKVESVFESLHPEVKTQPSTNVQPNAGDYANLNQQQVTEIANQFVDADGNVDINGLNQALNQANLQAQQARVEAARAREEIARFEENQQTKEAYAKYPQLDPLNKGKFDRKFYELVRDRMVSNFARGITKTFREVADDIAGIYNPVNTKKVAEEAVTQYKERQQARRQGPIEEGKGQPPTTQATLDELRRATRQGKSLDNPALDERLRNLGIIS